MENTRIGLGKKIKIKKKTFFKQTQKKAKEKWFSSYKTGPNICTLTLETLEIPKIVSRFMNSL